MKEYVCILIFEMVERCTLLVASLEPIITYAKDFVPIEFVF